LPEGSLVEVVRKYSDGDALIAIKGIDARQSPEAEPWQHLGGLQEVKEEEEKKDR
jgi:hypothetical protein